MTDSSCDPSPNTGATPIRASLKILRTSRSHSPHTVGGRTMVHDPAIARTSSSAASLLWPYGVTGEGGRGSSIGFPGTVGPAAASDGVLQIARDQAYIGPAECLRLGGVPYQARHPVAACAQGLHQGRTDESRAAGDERPHRGLS